MNIKSISMLAIVLCIGVYFSGCAKSLPIRSSLNDFVMMETETNSYDKVQFQYESKVVDGLIKPFERDKVNEIPGQIGYNHTESATLGRMMKEYMENKFVYLDGSGSADDGDVTVIKAVLTDFWIEQYSSDSTGHQVMAALGGGEINMICVARAKVLLTVNRGEEEYTKMISITSEDTYVQGYSTGTSTSNLYRGKDSKEFVHANNINKANNKVIMMMNAYLEEIGL